MVKDLKQENVSKGGVYVGQGQKSQGLRDPPQGDFNRKENSRLERPTSGFTGGRRPDARILGPESEVRGTAQHRFTQERRGLVQRTRFRILRFRKEAAWGALWCGYRRGAGRGGSPGRLGTGGASPYLEIANFNRLSGKRTVRRRPKLEKC